MTIETTNNYLSPQEQKFINAMKDWKKINNTGSIGGMLASVFLGIVHKNIAEDDQEKGKEVIEKKKEESPYEKMKKFLEKNKEYFTTIGIEIIQETGDSAIITQKGELPTIKVGCHLSDSRKFLEFLENIQNTDDKEIKEGIEFILKSFKRQIKRNYIQPESIDENFLELYFGRKKIPDAGKKFDDKIIDDAIQNINIYMDTAKGEYLREYLIAEKSQIMEEDLTGQCYGTPSGYLNDMIPKRYEELTGKRFNALQEAEKNPKAEKLAKNIKEKMIGGFTFVIENIDKENKNEYTQKMLQEESEIYPGLNNKEAYRRLIKNALEKLGK